MKCPFCDELEDKVVDSRMAKEGEVVRRRRECLGCKRRYTTYERVEEILPVVVKKDGRRETFDRSKSLSGLKKACEKRPISTATIEGVTDRIEKRIQEMGETEIESRVIGIIHSRNPEIDLTSHAGMRLGELGIDSIELLNIVFEIEEAFGIAIADDDLRELKTTDDLLRLVGQRLTPKAS